MENIKTKNLILLLDELILNEKSIMGCWQIDSQYYIKHEYCMRQFELLKHRLENAESNKMALHPLFEDILKAHGLPQSEMKPNNSIEL